MSSHDTVLYVSLITGIEIGGHTTTPESELKYSGNFSSVTIEVFTVSFDLFVREIEAIIMTVLVLFYLLM